MKDLRVTKNNEEIKLEDVWGELESKRKFAEIITHKISESNYSFPVKQRVTQKV